MAIITYTCKNIKKLTKFLKKYFFEVIFNIGGISTVGTNNQGPSKGRFGPLGQFRLWEFLPVLTL